MESSVVLKKPLFEASGAAAVNMGISREQLIALALAEYLANHRGNEPATPADETESVRNASMADIWELIKDDSW